MTHRGVVSLLDAVHDAAIRSIWDRLTSSHAYGNLRITPIPHLTYHVAANYGDDLTDRLAALAATTSPFKARAAGIGVFPAVRSYPYVNHIHTQRDECVIYVSIVRNQPLNDVHGQVWASIDPIAAASNGLYRPARWVPHITIAHVNAWRGDALQIADVVAAASSEMQPWEIEISQLAVIEGAGPHARVVTRVPLSP